MAACLRQSGCHFVVPAPQSSFRRRPESRGVGIGKCSAVEDYARRGACPPLGSGLGMAEPPVRIRRMKPQLPVFTPWFAGASRDERLVRKLVADSDPGWVAPLRSAGIQRGGGLVARVIPRQLNGTAAILIPTCDPRKAICGSSEMVRSVWFVNRTY